MTLACPACGVGMLAGMLRGTVIDRCAGCRGVWFERGELASVLDMSADLPPQPAAVGIGKRRCPACGIAMHVRQYRGAEAVNATFCSGCGGVFLDRGELGRIQAVAEACDGAFPAHRAERFAAQAAKRAALADGRGVPDPAGAAPAADRARLAARVYALLAATLVGAAAAAGLAVHAGLVGLLLGIGAFVVARLLNARRRASPANAVLLFAFPALAAAAFASLANGLWGDGGRTATSAAALAATGLLGLVVAVGVTRREWDGARGAALAQIGVAAGALVLIVVQVVDFAGAAGGAREFSLPATLFATLVASIVAAVVAFELPRAMFTARLDEPVAIACELWLRAAAAFVMPFMAQGNRTIQGPSGVRRIVHEVMNPPPPERP